MAERADLMQNGNSISGTNKETGSRPLLLDACPLAGLSLYLERIMGRKFRFTAVIERSEVGAGGAFVRIPFDVEKIFGRKRVKVKASISGEPYRGSLIRMGTECHVLGILKEIREKTGRSVGDEIEIILEEDVEPREVEVPGDLAAALRENPEAAALFEKLSFTHRKEYAKWIEEAKNEGTRASRIEKTITVLLEGKKGR